MPTWDPTLYLQFNEQRTQPARDLLARVRYVAPARVIDLGCGPGNSTALLRERWPHAHLVGLDHSPAMLAEARATALTAVWRQGDIATWGTGEAWDVVFSNAALQWVPDHATHLPRLFHAVCPGGVLAVQIPTHLHSALHQAMLTIAADPAWRAHTVHAAQAIIVHPPAYYYGILAPLTDHVDLWETEYVHIMPDVEAIVTWIKGTGLRPFLEALPTDEQRDQFEQRLLTALRTAYPTQPNGRVLFPFRRLFMVAYRHGVQGNEK